MNYFPPDSPKHRKKLLLSNLNLPGEPIKRVVHIYEVRTYYNIGHNHLEESEVDRIMCCPDGRHVNLCGCFGVQLALVFGAVVGILFAFGLIPGIVTAAWIAFGLAVLLLIFLIAALLTVSDRSRILCKCLRKNICCLLIGIIGSIILTIIALSIVLIPTVTLIAAIVALAAFFFALMIIGLISFICCIVEEYSD